MKTIALFLLTSALAFATPALAPAPCCAEKAALEKDLCYPALSAAAFSKNSLYQAETAFTTDTGAPFTLGALRGRPVVLAMFFATCGYACPLTVTDMQALREKLPAAIRDRAAFVLVTLDVARDTTAVLAKYRTQRALDASWTLLRGNDDSVRELAALIGVKFKQETDGTFAHSNLITLLNAQGEIVHQRLGLKGGLDEAAAALVPKS